MITRLSMAHGHLHDIVDANPHIGKDVSDRLINLAADIRKTCTEANAYSAFCVDSQAGESE